MARKRVDVRLPEELLARVHGARGDVTFTGFVERALESALGSAGSGTVAETSARVPRDPVPTRAPVPRIAGLHRASSLVKRDVRPIPKKS